MGETKRFDIINAILLGFIGGGAVLILTMYVIAYSGPRSKPASVLSAKNLKQIFTGLYAYSQENDGRYPAYAADYEGFAKGFDRRVRIHDAASTEKIPPSAFTNNITAALWLLVREDKTPTPLYANPGSSDKVDKLEPGKKVTEHYDFKSPSNFSYSFINFYDKEVSKKWSMAAGANYALAGDDNDAGPKALSDGESGNSSNHGFGQNFLFGDGHADWHSSPMSAFSKADNAYTYQKSDGTTSKANPTHCDGSTVQAANLNTDVFLIPVNSLQQ